MSKETDIQSEMQLVEVLTEETQNTGAYTWGVDSTSNAHQKLSQYDRYRIQVHGVRYEPQWKRTFRCENKNVQQEDGGCLSPTFKMIKPNHLGNDDDVRLDVRLQRKNNLNHSGWSVVASKGNYRHEDVFSPGDVIKLQWSSFGLNTSHLTAILVHDGVALHEFFDDGSSVVSKMLLFHSCGKRKGKPNSYFLSKSIV